jgi:uncharacterized protein (TIGR03437 family)
VVLYGDRLGPAVLAGSQVSNGVLSNSLANAQVLFDGIPAPLLYSSAGQVAAIVPYAVDGQAGTQVTVKNGSVVSDKVALPVAATAPGIFSANLSGTGQGAILNQDLTVNSSTSPAAAGSVVVIYATGEGQTTPAGIDGKLALGPVYPAPKAAVSVTIGGVAAEVLYAGAAPSLATGVMQVNARIPAGMVSGDNTVTVSVGAAASQLGITVAVKP